MARGWEHQLSVVEELSQANNRLYSVQTSITSVEQLNETGPITSPIQTGHTVVITDS